MSEIPLPLAKLRKFKRLKASAKQARKIKAEMKIENVLRKKKA